MTITILTHDTRWKGLGPTVKRAAEAAFVALQTNGWAPSFPLKGGAGECAPPVCLTILLTNDAEVKTLNAQYRGKNKATNVLSFPNGEMEEGVLQLGDIALAYETIAAEAAKQGKALKHHISHLAVHGTLHLLGFDHEADDEAEAMEASEIAILARMGIANPYESE